MLKTRLGQSALVMISALAAGTAPTVTARQEWLENRCAAPVSILRKATNAATRVFPGLSNESAVCAARSQEALLLLTGLMMDRAALSAAKGVDAAQVALGIKRTLAEQIAQLERAVGGFGTGTTSEVIVTEIAAQSTTLSLELEKRRNANALDDEARAQLAVAQRSLHEVSYYGVSAVAGGKLFGDFMRSNASKTTLYTALSSPQIGFGSDFAKRVPERAAKLPATFTNTVALRNAIGQILADPDKGAKDGEERARDQAKKDGDRIKKDLESFHIATTPTK